MNKKDSIKLAIIKIKQLEQKNIGIKIEGQPTRLPFCHFIIAVVKYS